MKKQVQQKAAKREKHQREAKKESAYILRLYVTGSTPRAKSAIMKVKKFCDEHLKGQYELDVIDIYQQPAHAREAQIVAAPTLVKKLPEPLRRLVGDFSNESRVMVALGLPE
ncbi:MAG TPA: circadian clock KaiB family protein [Candidatus Acidoferrum sp.]|nr:circadian clock KaiB family protein [Candidatus Acidoferrum sp.]